ncbi:aspartyl/asparaginyl beta-hydroxylase domain-containing protein [Dyella solisilvae]|uniref:Aspartyl/asparaginyl beta-hydroxylase domain-containing protein n=1 Tax=Dyella solisilvae TaxID=1920168 RepID=A0A370K3Y6_9GAMM|nr:aspartyl/asparaginyl beta-hydroxylase domain-containing protein [Dyella solisilvae]RDI97349.1 aspartyl/asparaginyl beta-hydroxylase domain-containing protein [Dyella solisilvae]
MESLYELSSRTMRRVYDARIKTPSVLDAETYFPDAPTFQAAWPQIRREALAVLANAPSIPRFHEIMPTQADLSANDGKDWRMYLLKVYGQPVRSHLAACPVLASLLEAAPDVLSATLSYLAPHKHIPRHSGPFRGILRYQLNLEAPPGVDGQPGATLWLAGEEYRLAEGESLLWDDTYPHEVWNRSDRIRIALLLDVRRPAMPLELRMLSRAVTTGVGMVARWRGLD